MKRILVAILIVLAGAAYAQTNLNVSGGYFGHMLSHPGVTFGAELERANEIGQALVTRLDVSGYNHPRNHAGLAIQAGVGLRREFPFGLFIEESVGIGLLVSALNSDEVYTVADDGQVGTAAKLNPVDLEGSLSVAVGYDFSSGPSSFLVWIRPTIMWQYPHMRNSNFAPILQAGFTKTVATSR
jgi:hypothetical protein